MLLGHLKKLTEEQRNAATRGSPRWSVRPSSAPLPAPARTPGPAAAVLVCGEAGDPMGQLPLEKIAGLIFFSLLGLADKSRVILLNRCRVARACWAARVIATGGRVVSDL